MKYLFKDIVDVARASHCALCETYVYTLPCALDRRIEFHMAAIGRPKYSLDQTQMLRIENEWLIMVGRLGRPFFDVKFHKEAEKNKPLFDLILAGFISEVQGITVTI